MDESLRHYYETELSILRRQGREFSERYPKIAGRLALDGTMSSDPHVERLIQGFAFLAGRVHHKIDDEFPEITQSFLSVLYPHLMRPIPSHTVVQFVPDNEGAKLTGRNAMPRHTMLLTQPIDGMPCRFRTVYPVDVWPIKVAEAQVHLAEGSKFEDEAGQPDAIIRLRLEVTSSDTFARLDIDRLRLFIDADGVVAHTIYEALFNNLDRIVFSDGQPDGKRMTVPASRLREVGFAEGEEVLDYGPRSFPGYRILQEYFAFPNKFLFFDLDGLDEARRIAGERELHVDLLLTGVQRSEPMQRLVRAVTATTFKLGCTPAINLFHQRGEPISLTHTRIEYPVVADRRWPKGMEIYAVNDVSRVSRGRSGEEVTPVPPIFAIHGVGEGGTDGVYWHARRRPSVAEDDAGTELFLSLVDRHLDPMSSSTDILTLTLTCTNRDLPAILPHTGAVGEFEIEVGASDIRVRALRKPTPSLRPAERRGAMWRLVSHLSLNHLSLVEGGRDALLEILNLYNFADSAAFRQELAGILDVRSRPSVARVGEPPRSAFCRGMDVELMFDEERFVGSGMYLLARVLDHFFGLYCAANSFTRLTIRSKQREGIVAKWPPRMGTAILA